MAKIFKNHYRRNAPLSDCGTCAMEDKLLQCCGRYPMTGERSALELGNGRTVYACPRLSALGLCGIYENRPLACRQFFCC
jgi:hypothetical protein